MRIRKGGRVGIGTTDPKVIHHISTANESYNYAVIDFRRFSTV